MSTNKKDFGMLFTLGISQHAGISPPALLTCLGRSVGCAAAVFKTSYALEFNCKPKVIGVVTGEFTPKRRRKAPGNFRPVGKSKDLT